MQATRDAVMAPLPLIPFVPKLLMATVEKAVLREGRPIGCSNAGDMPPALSRIDGTEADFFIGRMIENGVTEGALPVGVGHLALGVTISGGTVAISIASWKVGGLGLGRRPWPRCRRKGLHRPRAGAEYRVVRPVGW